MIKAGQKVTRWPLGSGPELHGIVLERADPRVWAGTAFEQLSAQERQDKSGGMLETFGQVPVYYAQGRGLAWQEPSTLFIRRNRVK